MTDPSREAFEAFVYRDYGAEEPWLVRKFADGSYKDKVIQVNWIAWQAALAWKAEQDDSRRIRNALRRIVRKDGAIDVTDATINHARRILGDKANGNG